MPTQTDLTFSIRLRCRDGRETRNCDLAQRVGHRPAAPVSKVLTETEAKVAGTVQAISASFARRKNSALPRLERRGVLEAGIPVAWLRACKAVTSSNRFIHKHRPPNQETKRS